MGDLCLIAGGGTAGHLLPGLAVARALVSRGHDPSAVHFAVSEREIDARLLSDTGFEYTPLPGRGIERRLTFANVGAVWGLLRAFWRSLRLVGRRRPQVVLAVGGYASAACAFAAVVRRVPLVVAEQNARAGLANRLAGRFAAAAAVAFDATDLPRAEVTGNPVRREVLAVERGRDRDAAREAFGLPADRVVLAVFSGSLGSRRINTALHEALPVWRDRADLAVYHVVGHRDWDDAGDPAEAYAHAALWYRAVRYEDRMPELFAAADLALCRAGGTTVAELAVVGLPAVLVPLPIAPRDHQTANAEALVRSGGALLIADGDLDGARLRAEIDPLLDDPSRRTEMARAAAALGRRDAADAVADLLERYVR